MKSYLDVLKKYAVFSGRSLRSEYLYFVLISTIISIILKFALEGTHFKFISSLYSLAIFVPSLAVSIRRIHDVNKSGWWILCPFYNLFLLFSKGDTGANQFGENPKNNPIAKEIEQIGTTA